MIYCNILNIFHSFVVEKLQSFAEQYFATEYNYLEVIQTCPKSISSSVISLLETVNNFFH